MATWTRLAVFLDANTPVPDAADVMACLREKYNIGYVGIYDQTTTKCLYVQTHTKRNRMTPTKLLKLCKQYGATEVPRTFSEREGILLDEEGDFRPWGKRRSKKRPMLLPVTNTNISKRMPLKQDDEDPMFVAVYSGFNRVWKIVSWNLHTKEYKRESCQKFREYVLKRQHHKCNYCGAEVAFGEYSNADMDHVIPLHAGGESELHNLQVLCVACHRKKTSLESRKVSVSLSSMTASARVPIEDEFEW